MGHGSRHSSHFRRFRRSHRSLVAALLQYEIEDNHDFVKRLLSEGAIGESDVVTVDGRLYFADAVAAKDPTGKGPRIYFQQVPEAKSAKNRVHLDIPVDRAVSRTKSRDCSEWEQP